jgi:3-oxoacyl-[acyl-carrier-protein] synthase II
MGLYSPIGNTLVDFKESLIQCRHGIRHMQEWERFDCLRTKLAGVCENVDTKRIPANHRRKMGRVAHLSCLAAMDAIADAGLPESAVGSPRCGVSFGSSAGRHQSICTS